MGHTHSVIDNDLHFSIDTLTREIHNGSKKVKLIQGDHASEIFTFEIPRYVDGHDMSLCNKIAVHYINVGTTGNNPDVYIVTDVAINESEDKVTFSWTIYRTATKYAGTLNFLIKFSCIDEDGTITYQWNTDIFKGITVSSGIDNEGTIVEEYYDILEKWKNEILTKAGTVKSVNGVEPDNNGNVTIDVPEDFVLFKKITVDEAAPSIVFDNVFRDLNGVVVLIKVPAQEETNSYAQIRTYLRKDGNTIGYHFSSGAGCIATSEQALYGILLNINGFRLPLYNAESTASSVSSNIVSMYDGLSMWIDADGLILIPTFIDTIPVGTEIAIYVRGKIN